ncbi:hypothetical protein WJX72_010720 [[Myrmecia] bisecta]|uniref:Ran guanine nucleotide release factor n=1 Tax=[Myrmecia] bisecta TaxID=41462 RepID=A0AAW1Q1Y1_9CHLO
MTANESLAQRDLFGGALKLSMPMRFVDVSDFRPVPDNQEVFADANRDQSVVVEVLERADVPDDRCAVLFFEDLAEHNEAASSSLDSVTTPGPTAVPHLPNDTFVSVARGAQAVSKGRQGQEALNQVQICQACIRLPSVDSDLLITLNTPMHISEHSAAAEHAGAGAKDAHVTAPQLLQDMLLTLEIKDWGLFGGA